MRLLTKKIQEIGLLEIKCPHNKRNLSIESMITDKMFYIAINKDKKPYLRKEHQPNSSCNGTGWVKMVSLCCLLYSGMIIVKVDFERLRQICY